ncbi:hypothetical protein KSS87_010992 [Heliosperma pusillum]|nr:hypothetical protein KSS87_010992 [Heliosperma pusillum]
MAMKAAMMTALSAASKPRGLNRLCTTSAFNFTPPQPSSQQPAAPVADPSPNLFVSDIIHPNDMQSFSPSLVVRCFSIAPPFGVLMFKRLDCPFLNVGLSKRTTTDGLREAFSKFGEVVHAKVVTDHVSGFSKGFGFVKYATIEEASSGIEGMNGAFLDGWVIFAEFAKPRPPPAYQQQNGSSPFGRSGY